MSRSLCAVATLSALLLGCREQHAPGPSADLSGPRAAPEVLDVTFEELYPLFLWRKSMSQGERAKLWGRYQGRWVRWEGVIASITDKGLTLKHLLSTSTFDVSLICDASVVRTLKSRFSVGDRVRYMGLLDSYDDVFRTMYLRHGMVLAKVPHGDLGIPADMSLPVVP